MFRKRLFLAFVIVLFLHAPIAVHAQDETPIRLDRFGDPLPPGVLARLGTVRFNRCDCAAYSPDGKIIATADSDQVDFWDATTFKRIRQLPVGNRRSAVGLIFSHDSKKLAVIGWGGTSVQIWDLDTFKDIVLTQANGGSAGGDWSSAAAFSSDDKTLVAATSRNLFVWDVVSGKKLKEFPFRFNGDDIDVRMLAVSEDGKVVATQGDSKTRLWDAQTGAMLHDVGLLSGGDTMKFSRDGKTLVVPGNHSWLRIVSVEAGKKIQSLHVPERALAVAFSPDGKTLGIACSATTFSSSTDGDQVIQLWNLANLKAAPVTFPAPGIDSVMFSPDGKTLAWGCNGQTICFMDSTTGKDLRPTASHRGAIKSLVYLPDGKRVASASADGTIRIWDAATGESLSVLRGHVGRIPGLALYPNGKLLASCGWDRSFRLWDIERGKELAVLTDEGNSILAAAFSADGKMLASGGYRGVIFLRDPATGKQLDEFEAGSISSLAFSPDNKKIAALGDHSEELVILDLATKNVKKIPAEKVRGGSSIAYSPDGKILAVAYDETLLLLDTATYGVQRTLPGHYNRRGCVIFSPDGRYLASVGDGWGEVANRSIRVFELASGTEIHSFKKELPIFAAAFSPDGSKLAVGGADTTAVILDLKNLTGKQRPVQMTENELAARWTRLTEVDAGKAYEARADLLHAPQSTVPFLAKRLQPAPAIDAKRVEGWIKDLDSDKFKVRAEAFKELEHLGELVREPMQKALAANPTLETRQRLGSLLGKLSQFTASQLQILRGIEILEGIGTPEAFKVIERLTQGNPDGLATIESLGVFARKQKKNAPLPPSPKPQENPVALSQPVPLPGPVLADRDGDPMPVGAIARLGTARWRFASEPRRIIVSADGKKLAVVNDFSGVELLDSQNGRSIKRAKTGLFSMGIDLRMAVALSADLRKIAALEGHARYGSVLSLLDGSKVEKVIIDYGRKEGSYPIIPEEIEEARNTSGFNIEYLSAADFSPDAKTVVGSVRFEWERSSDKMKKEVKESHLVAWNVSTGKEIRKSSASEKEINTIMFSSDGKTMTVVDPTGVGFWDFATHQELKRWQSKAPLFSARFSPDRTWLATGSKEEILLWEVATGKVVRRLAVPGKEIKAIAFSPDGKLLAGGGDKTIRTWDPLTGKSHGDCSAFSSPVEAVAFSSDGKTLFSGHQQEHVLRRWNVAGLMPSGVFNSPITPARMLSFSRDSRTILASSTGEDFYLWETETGKPCPLPKKEDEQFLTDWLASSGQSALLRCEEGFGSQFAMLLTGKIERLDQIPGFLGSSVDGQRMLVQSEKDKMPCLTVLKVTKDKAKAKEKRKDDVEREFIWKEGNEVRAAIAPDGKTVAAAGKNIVCFFDVTTGQERRYQHSTNVKPELPFRAPSVKFAADGSRIALLGSDGKIRILAVSDGRRIAEFATKSRSMTTGLAFSPDGQTLLTTSFNARPYAWEVATGQVVRKLEAGTYLYSPDNRLLAASAETLKVFDLYSGQVLRECKAEGNGLGNFVFSPNSKFLATSCTDTTILVWPSVSTAAEAKAGKPWDEKILTQVLTEGNATEAYEAIGRMIVEPEQALSFLERKLHAIPKIDAKHVERLIADLNSNLINRRDPAMKELTQLGVLVEPTLRAALSSEKIALESRGRIEKLLRELDEKQPSLSGEDVLHIRAIQALERIGTKRAKQLLANLAQGAELSPRTLAAVDALRRIERQFAFDRK